MSKNQFSITLITRGQAKPILAAHHYLGSTFKSGVNYGLWYHRQLWGVCIFTGLPVPELAKGMFGLNRTEQNGLWELSRLCLIPNEEHNLASWFVSRCIRLLRKQEQVRAILSYADNDFHEGIVYRALGFQYYGLTAVRKDFYILQEDGSFKKHNRGRTKGVQGEWRYRSRKHRFVKMFDDTLQMQWREVK